MNRPGDGVRQWYCRIYQCVDLGALRDLDLWCNFAAAVCVMVIYLPARLKR